MFSLELSDDSVAIEKSLVKALLDIGSWFRGHCHPTNATNALLDGHQVVEHLAAATFLTVFDDLGHFTTQ